MATKKHEEVFVGPLPTSEEERLEYLREVLEEQIDFYQSDVNWKAWLYYIFTLLSLIGAAAVPVLVAVLPTAATSTKLWVALPAAVAGLATSINNTFGFKDDWITSYVTMCSLLDERDRFMTRAEPEYGREKDLPVVMDTLMNRVSKLVMQETAQFKNRFSGSGRPRK